MEIRVTATDIARFGTTTAVVYAVIGKLQERLNGAPSRTALYIELAQGYGITGSYLERALDKLEVAAFIAIDEEKDTIGVA